MSSRSPVTTGLIVYNNDGTPIGFCLFNRGKYDLDLTRIAVLPEFRRKGVGRLLVSYLMSIIDHPASRRTWLECHVDERNTPAHLFLSNQGFIADVGDREGFYHFQECPLAKKERGSEDSCAHGSGWFMSRMDNMWSLCENQLSGFHSP